jgi:hypothetical protein
MVELAQVFGRRSITPAAQSDDLTEARRLLERAVQQRHRWDGSTEGALEQLLRTLGLLEDFEAVLSYAAPPPVGRARAEEAARPNVLSGTP